MINHALTWLTKPYRGSNRLSRWIRTRIEHKQAFELIGVPLIALAVFMGVIVPTTQAGFTSTEIYFDTHATTVNAIVAPSQFRWPLATFGISQYFGGGHAGLDLTNPAGTPIYAITDGVVMYAGAINGGYGKHVIVSHKEGMTSIYAHMSRIDVTTGQTVGKDTELGTVGATGWATGNHLHLEIAQNGVPLNPMEILPDIKKYESRVAVRNEQPQLPNFSL